MKHTLFNVFVKDTQFHIEENSNEETLARYSVEIAPIESNNGNGEDLISIYTKGHIRPIIIRGWTIEPSIQVEYDWKSYHYKVILVDCNRAKIVLEGQTSFGTQSSYNLPINVVNDIFRNITKILNCSNKEEWIIQTRSTSNNVYTLRPDEIFVFGSDLDGNHIRGAALQAFEKFGAIQGQGIGLQGKSYAIPTLLNEINKIKPYVDDFVEYARCHSEKKFLVTRIGCGLAGFSPEQIAPLFSKAQEVNNIYLPKEFWKVLLSK